MSARVSGFYKALTGVAVLFVISDAYNKWPEAGTELGFVWTQAISWTVALPIIYATIYIFRGVTNRIRMGVEESQRFPNIEYFMNELASVVKMALVFATVAFGTRYINEALAGQPTIWLQSSLPDYFVVITVWSLAIITKNIKRWAPPSEEEIPFSKAVKEATRVFISRWNPVYGSVSLMFEVLAFGILIGMFASMQNAPNIPMWFDLSTYRGPLAQSLQLFVDTGAMLRLGNVVILGFPVFMKVYCYVVMVRGTISFYIELWRSASQFGKRIPADRKLSA